jgi:hypothetical protein
MKAMFVMALVLVGGCRTVDWIALWPAGTNAAPVVVEQPAVAPVTAAVLEPTKIAHGARVALAAGVAGGEVGQVSGVADIRLLEITSDRFVTTAGLRARCIRTAVVAGKVQLCADDWINSAGQVMVFEYWTPKSSGAAHATNNPIAACGGTERAWYRCYAAH